MQMTFINNETNVNFLSYFLLGLRLLISSNF